MALPIRHHAADAGGQGQIEEHHFGPEHSHAHQTTGQQHQAVPRQRQKDEARFQKEDHHQTGDEQTDRLQLY
ncbi:hypothetical protein D3C76_845300 [compost metagenome]